MIRSKDIFKRFYILFGLFAFLHSNAQKGNIQSIQFSKDSQCIKAIIFDDKNFQFNHPEYFLSQSLMVNNIFIKSELIGRYIQKKCSTIKHDQKGYKIELKFCNISQDTVQLSNVFPFNKDEQRTLITGLGNHRLSRTHLFLPNKTPVNVIVPDNAWELGYNNMELDKSHHLYGFSRRKEGSTVKGKNKRFETILYPKGEVTYSIWIESYQGDWQAGLLQVFRDRKLYDLEDFNDSLYRRPDLSWMRHAYTMHLMMSWDKFFYDPIRKKYTIQDFVERGNRLYGGDDIIAIWPTWPTLGLDQRNQFDLFNNLPGGMDSISALSNYLIKNKKHLFVSYNPWDMDTRSLDHHKGLSWLIKNTQSDGVVLDTFGNSTDSLQKAADSVRKGVIMYSEGMAIPKDMQGIISGRVHNALYYPPMLNLNKFIQPGFTIFRVAELFKEPIEREFATSFFNGYGTELNIMAPGQPEWVEKQYAFLNKNTQLLRQSSDNFNTNNAVPLIPTLQDRIWVNKWPTAQKTIYTIYSIIPQGFKDLLFQVENKVGYHFVDLYHHKLLTPSMHKGAHYIEAETNSFHNKYLGTNNEGAIDCIAQLPEILQVHLQSNVVNINVNSLDPILSKKEQSESEFEIRVYPSNSQSIPVVFNFENHKINVDTLFYRFEGKLIFQLIQKFSTRENILDETILNFPAGIPRLNMNKELKIYKEASKFGMEHIPSGEFTFKQTHGDDFIPYPIFNDTNKIKMPEYWMDRYPVTNDQFYSFIKASNYQPSDSVNYLKHWENGIPRTADLKKPVVNISYEDASAYAHFYNKELPTEKEWQYAAQTTSLNEWPWHQEKPVTRTLEEVTNTLSVINIKGIDSLYANLGNGHLDTVGAYPNGVNPNGLFDLVGSVWQLTQDIYSSGSYQYIIMKGGSYFKPSGSWWYVQGGPRELSFAQYLLRVNQGFERNATVGFRCIAKK